MEIFSISTEQAMRTLGAKFAHRFGPGTLVFMEGELGVGKTTFVRGLVKELGFDDPVRSPTFNLMQVFDTTPPVLHVDLYRVKSHEGLGIEDYLDSHICLIEWPDRAHELASADEVWHIVLSFDGEGRTVQVMEPHEASLKS